MTMILLDALLASLQDDLLITLSVGVGCLIVARCLEQRRYFSLRAAISFVAAFAWMVGTKYTIMNGPVDIGRWAVTRYTVFFLLFAFSVPFWSKANACQSLFAITVAYSMQNLCERLIEIPRFSVQPFPLWLDRLCLALLMGICLFLYYRVIVGTARQRSMFDFTNLNNRMMLFLGAGVVFMSVIMDLELRKYSEQGNIGLMNCFNLISAVFSFLTIVVCMSHLRASDSERRAEISEHLLYSERQRYAQDKQIHDAINIKCHDIRHQIAALGEEGYRDELQRIGRLVDIYDSTPSTQNSALDVVLAGKMLACTNLGITLTCLADGRRMGFMENSDIYALFGNILDNAMEAAQAMQDPDKRMISLTVSTAGDLLMIDSQNFCANEVVFKDGLPETSKQDKDYHGYGTRSIRLLTEKYGGDLQLDAEGGVFRLSIMIPIPS